MTVKEASKVLNVKETTIRTYIKSGKLKATAKKQGLRTIYDISETDLKQFQTANQ